MSLVLTLHGRVAGLAANQVGLPYRLFIINPSADPAEKELEQVFINPQIIKRNGSEDAEEGCLSLPEIYGPVTRAERITVEAFDLTGENFAYELAGIHARVVQHESDHLDGVMFTDKVAADALAELQPLLDDMTAQMTRQQQEGQLASNDELLAELKRLQTERTDG